MPGVEKEAGLPDCHRLLCPIVKSEGAHKQVIIGEIDMEILEETEENYKVRADLAEPGFHYAVKSNV